MELTLKQFNDKLECIQCGYGQLTEKYANMLTIGKQDDCLKDKLTYLRVILRMLICYNTEDLPQVTTDNNVLDQDDLMLLFKTADNILN